MRNCVSLNYVLILFCNIKRLFCNWQHSFPSSSDTSDVLSIHKSFQIGFLIKFIGITDQGFLLAVLLVSPFVFLGVFYPSVQKQTI
jgi:hypothetical protein